MNLPIFHGRLSSNKQIQVRRMCYSRLHQSEQQRGRNGAVQWKLGFISLAIREFVFQPTSCCLAKQGQPTMLHCGAQNKSATQANNNAGLSPGRSAVQNRILKELSVPEGDVVHERTNVVTVTQSSLQLFFSFLFFVCVKILQGCFCFCTQLQCYTVHICVSQQRFWFGPFIPRIPVVSLKYPITILGYLGGLLYKLNQTTCIH